MSWTHSICPKCWNKQNPDKPVKIDEKWAGDDEICCFCGVYHASGIYVRQDPKTLERCGHT